MLNEQIKDISSIRYSFCEFLLDEPSDYKSEAIFKLHLLSLLDNIRIIDVLPQFSDNFYKQIESYTQTVLDIFDLREDVSLPKNLKDMIKPNGIKKFYQLKLLVIQELAKFIKDFDSNNEGYTSWLNCTIYHYTKKPDDKLDKLRYNLLEELLSSIGEKIISDNEIELSYLEKIYSQGN